MASVVIPSYNNWHLTHSLLMDVYRCLPSSTEVIVVDDCSTNPEVSSGLKWWRESMFSDRMRVFVNEQNVGFLRTANFGVARAINEVVMLISNDVKISDRTLQDKVVMALEAPTDKPVLVGARLLSGDTGWNTFKGRTFPYLEGWFLAFRKSEWARLGGFDERFQPFDFEDVDISTTYLQNSGKLVQIDADVVHLGAQTYKYSPEREKQTKINQEKFKNKWVTN